MHIYLGASQKLKININGITYNTRLFSQTADITTGIRLRSLDSFILKDSTGLFLVAKENTTNG